MQEWYQAIRKKKQNKKKKKKKKNNLETLIQTIKIYSQDIEMEFGINKCAMLIMKSRKRETTKRIELPNQESIRMFGEKENYKYLEILEVDIIKQRWKKK